MDLFQALLLTAAPWFLLPSLALFPSGSWLMRSRGSSASSRRVAKSCLGTSGWAHQAVCPASFILFLLQSLLQQQQLINKGKVIYLLQAITSYFIFSFLWKPQENQNTFFEEQWILRLSWALPSNISTAFDRKQMSIFYWDLPKIQEMYDSKYNEENEFA